jgi:hypothetical protein
MALMVVGEGKEMGLTAKIPLGQKIGIESNHLDVELF